MQHGKCLHFLCTTQGNRKYGKKRQWDQGKAINGQRNCKGCKRENKIKNEYTQDKNKRDGSLDHKRAGKIRIILPGGDPADEHHVGPKC
jgi:hypothetical protein